MAQVQNVYEIMLIFDSNRFAANRTALPAEVEKLIGEAGGEVLISRLWDERKLAYPIKGQKKGTYWLIYYRGDPAQVGQLERLFEIHESILRQLTLKIHPHLIDAILEHARGTGSADATEEEAVSPAAQNTETAERPAATT